MDIDFAEITACGESCAACAKRADGSCIGCLAADGKVPEWAESGECPVHACCKTHGARFCGMCSVFPCADLERMIHWVPDAVDKHRRLAEQYRAAQRQHGEKALSTHRTAENRPQSHSILETLQPSAQPGRR